MNTTLTHSRLIKLIQGTVCELLLIYTSNRHIATLALIFDEDKSSLSPSAMVMVLSKETFSSLVAKCFTHWLVVKLPVCCLLLVCIYFLELYYRQQLHRKAASGENESKK